MLKKPLTATAPRVKPAAASISARGTMQLLLTRGLFMLSGYVISVFLARGLGPIDFGTYGVLMSVLLWVEMLAGAGIPGATTQCLAQYQDQTAAVEQAARLLLCVWSLALFLVCWAFAPVFARFFAMPAGIWLFRLAVLDVPLTGGYVAYQGILFGNRQFGIVSLGFVLYSLTKLLGTIALYEWGLSVAGALVVNALATVGGLVYFVIKYPPRGPLPSYALMRTMVRVAIPMGLFTSATQVLLRLDLWALKGLWTGAAEIIGFYVAALNVARLLTVAPSVLTGVFFTALSRALAQANQALGQQYIQSSVRFILVAVVPCCVLIALHADEVMRILYTRTYQSGGLYLPYQLLGFAFLAFFDIFCHALMAAGKYLYSVSISLGLIPVACILNLLLVPRFGATGAACTLMITVGLGTVIAMALTYQQFGTVVRTSTLLRVTAATAATIAIDTQIPLTGPWFIVKFMLLLGGYTLLLGLLKELSREDMRALVIWRKVS